MLGFEPAELSLNSKMHYQLYPFMILIYNAAVFSFYFIQFLFKLGGKYASLASLAECLNVKSIP
jgi:hypothetical protein